jgi:hypothetical protein
VSGSIATIEDVSARPLRRKKGAAQAGVSKSRSAESRGVIRRLQLLGRLPGLRITLFGSSALRFPDIDNSGAVRAPRLLINQRMEGVWRRLKPAPN